MSGKMFSHAVRDFFFVDLLGGENYPNTIKSLKQKIANLGTIINSQRQQIHNQKQVIKQAYQLVRRYEQFIERDIARDSDVSIDFEKLGAVSIERQIERGKNSDLPFTTIGYKLDGQSQLNEWYIFCNQAKHEELVKQFNSFLQRKST